MSNPLLAAYEAADTELRQTSGNTITRRVRSNSATEETMDIIKYVGEADGKRALVEALGLEAIEVRREEFAATSGLGQNDPLIVELYVRKLPTNHLNDIQLRSAIRRIVDEVGSRFPEASIRAQPLSSELS
jgi:hypothetical protein